MRTSTLAIGLLVCTLSTASGGAFAPPIRPEPREHGHHDLTIDAVRWLHPVFGNGLGMRGGLLLGMWADLPGGEPSAESIRWSIGWETRGDALGLTGRFGSIWELLYSVRVRWSDTERAVVPAVQLTHDPAPMLPIMSLGLSVGLPIAIRDAAPLGLARALARQTQPRRDASEVDAGVAVYLHHHWFVVMDVQVGLEVFPLGDDPLRFVGALHVTL